MGSSDAGFEEMSGFQRFIKEIARRGMMPFSDITFFFFVVFAILVFGGLGIWIEVMKILLSEGSTGTKGIFTALATFYPALVGAASLQLVLESVGKTDKLMAIFAVAVLLLTIIGGVVISLFDFNQIHAKFSFWGTIALSFLGVWVWCVANGDDPNLRTDPSAATGGDTTKTLKGNTSGFTE